MDKIVDLRPVKAKLRTDIKKKRMSMPIPSKNMLDMKIQNRVLNMWAFREAPVILTYVSTPIEVDTKYLIETALGFGKAVAVPRCEGNGRTMNFYAINSLDELTPGAFGVLEPLATNNNPFQNFENSICIVPAFSFDKSGYRLGYGKGYYDRFLSQYAGVTIGICYSECVRDNLPHGKYDRSVQILVTEKDIINIVKEG